MTTLRASSSHDPGGAVPQARQGGWLRVSLVAVAVVVVAVLAWRWRATAPAEP